MSTQMRRDEQTMQRGQGMTEGRRCGRCGQFKAASEFYTRKAYCKPCARAYSREWRARNVERSREQMRRWRERHQNDPAWRERNAEYQRQWYDRNRRKKPLYGPSAPTERHSRRRADPALANTYRITLIHPDGITIPAGITLATSPMAAARRFALTLRALEPVQALYRESTRLADGAPPEDSRRVRGVVIYRYQIRGRDGQAVALDVQEQV